MIIKFLDKVFTHHLYLKLILFGLTIQLVSLFRDYPDNHPCGRVLSTVAGVNILINCDSAVYMKDAQEPSRLFYGTTVYQDRPFPTLTVALISKIWRLFNLPDYYENVTGNSGVITSYSLITYLLYLTLSALILGLAYYIGIKTISNIAAKYHHPRETITLISILLVILLSMNEITKTFFWTPGSQMFNILIPVYVFYLLQFHTSAVTTRFFYTHVVIFLVLLFSYAFSILLIIPLLILPWKSLGLRIASVSPVLLLYFSFPFFLKLIGGNFNNFGIGSRRLWLWTIDAFLEDKLLNKVAQNLLFFVESFPIIPSVLLLFILILFKKRNVKGFPFLKIKTVEFVTLTVYCTMLAFHGYYTRRLTYSLVIFVYLILILNILKHNKSNNVLQLTKILLFAGPISIFSWFFTNGPLI